MTGCSRRCSARAMRWRPWRRRKRRSTRATIRSTSSFAVAAGPRVDLGADQRRRPQPGARGLRAPSAGIAPGRAIRPREDRGGAAGPRGHRSVFRRAHIHVRPRRRQRSGAGARRPGRAAAARGRGDGGVVDRPGRQCRGVLDRPQPVRRGRAVDAERQRHRPRRRCRKGARLQRRCGAADPRLAAARPVADVQHHRRARIPRCLRPHRPARQRDPEPAAGVQPDRQRRAGGRDLAHHAGGRGARLQAGADAARADLEHQQQRARSDQGRARQPVADADRESRQCRRAGVRDRPGDRVDVFRFRDQGPDGAGAARAGRRRRGRRGVRYPAGPALLRRRRRHIRGFRYQSVGPKFADGNPTGGTSIDVGSVELRQRFGANWGAVAFVDAGQVGTSGRRSAGTWASGPALEPGTTRFSGRSGSTWRCRWRTSTEATRSSCISGSDRRSDGPADRHRGAAAARPADPGGAFRGAAGAAHRAAGGLGDRRPGDGNRPDRQPVG